MHQQNAPTSLDEASPPHYVVLGGGHYRVTTIPPFMDRGGKHSAPFPIVVKCNNANDAANINRANDILDIVRMLPDEVSMVRAIGQSQMLAAIHRPAKNWYCVAYGNEAGIYPTHADQMQAVRGWPRAIFRRLNTFPEALQFMVMRRTMPDMAGRNLSTTDSVTRTQEAPPVPQLSAYVPSSGQNIGDNPTAEASSLAARIDGLSLSSTNSRHPGAQRLCGGPGTERPCQPAREEMSHSSDNTTTHAQDAPVSRSRTSSVSSTAYSMSSVSSVTPFTVTIISISSSDSENTLHLNAGQTTTTPGPSSVSHVARLNNSQDTDKVYQYVRNLDGIIHPVYASITHARAPSLGKRADAFVQAFGFTNEAITQLHQALASSYTEAEFVSKLKNTKMPTKELRWFWGIARKHGRSRIAHIEIE
ncbi:hypothetical protein CERSUDRAFT_94918 [Gelatoporia subvermispora B]|uniref:Ribonuclease H1 N-terminal domain-containing protein n=1 Tax=Ceriporiopsis subvermispora (strain B) TaxID=914234 RepID=M2R0B7_CERS8|nr:hypothetical protein CERSUDRAFT_94918 [Gelatoporia subvermispora B]